MEAHAAELVRGLQLAMAAVGAKDGVIGIKGKKKHAVEAVTAACRGTQVRVQLLGDYYPAGDEYDLVFNVTGRLIPPGGIPHQRRRRGQQRRNVREHRRRGRRQAGHAQDAHHRRCGEIAGDVAGAARHHAIAIASPRRAD